MKKLILQREFWIELLKSKNLYEGNFKNRKVILLSLIWAFRDSLNGMHISNPTLGEDYLDCSEATVKRLLKELYQAGLITKRRNYNNPSSYFPAQIMKDQTVPFISKEKDQEVKTERSGRSTKPSSKEEGTKGKHRYDSSFYDDEPFCEDTYKRYKQANYPDTTAKQYAKQAYKLK
jgi:hypothetical protein